MPSRATAKPGTTLLHLVLFVLALGLFFSLIYFYGVCTVVLPACMSVYHVHSIDLVARKGHQISLELELETAVSHDLSAGN